MIQPFIAIFHMRDTEHSGVHSRWTTNYAACDVTQVKKKQPKHTHNTCIFNPYGKKAYCNNHQCCNWKWVVILFTFFDYLFFLSYFQTVYSCLVNGTVSTHINRFDALRCCRWCLPITTWEYQNVWLPQCQNAQCVTVTICCVPRGFVCAKQPVRSRLRFIMRFVEQVIGWNRIQANNF